MLFYLIIELAFRHFILNNLAILLLLVISSGIIGIYHFAHRVINNVHVTNRDLPRASYASVKKNMDAVYYL